MSAPLITLGDEFAQAPQSVPSAPAASAPKAARRSRRSQRLAMEELVTRAIEKKMRVQVTAAGATAALQASSGRPTDDMRPGALDELGGAGAARQTTPRPAAPRQALPARTAAAPHDMQALGRLKAGQMNQTEAAYAQHLLRRQAAGEIVWHRFEGLTLRLAARASYTPDFVVMRADGQIELHEVKGAKAIFRDDARAKTRIAAGEFPFRVLVVYPRDRAFSGWDIEEF